MAAAAERVCETVGVVDGVREGDGLREGDRDEEGVGDNEASRTLKYTINTINNKEIDRAIAGRPATITGSVIGE